MPGDPVNDAEGKIAVGCIVAFVAVIAICAVLACLKWA
jgi:hypothetical protein